eukprot:5332718-Amphidinium_carterae.1
MVVLQSAGPRRVDFSNAVEPKTVAAQKTCIGKEYFVTATDCILPEKYSCFTYSVVPLATITDCLLYTSPSPRDRG